MTAAACIRLVLDEWDGSDLSELGDINRVESRPSHRLDQTAGHTTDDYRSHNIVNSERTRLNQPYDIHSGKLHFASNEARQSRGHHQSGYESHVSNIYDRLGTFGSHNESNKSNFHSIQSDLRSNRSKRSHDEANKTTVFVIKNDLNWDGK